MKHLSVHELIDIVVGREGTGFSLLHELGSIYRISNAGDAELSLTPKQCERLKAALELGRRALLDQIDRGKSISAPRDVYERMQPLFATEPVEHFVVLVMNSRNQVVREVEIAKGSADRCLVHPRDVFRPAIAENAVGVIVCHNHPSGDPEPSEEDIRLTRRLGEAGKTVGIQLLDHVVIGSDRYVSLRERGAI